MLAVMDDRTVGLVLRALRRRRGWRQLDVAVAAGCSQSLVSLVERGHLESVAFGMLRRVFGALEVRLSLVATWRGADLDRLLDEEHAAIVAATADRLERADWQVLIEVTYSRYGERGSIDVLGVLPSARAALVCEIKSDVPSSEATGRKLDEKRRLAASIVRERLGWEPLVVGAVLIVPESPRIRRLLAGPAAALARAFPIASRAVTSWLKHPEGPLAATWFLTLTNPRNPRRVRRPLPRPRTTPVGTPLADPNVDEDATELFPRLLR